MHRPGNSEQSEQEEGGQKDSLCEWEAEVGSPLRRFVAVEITSSPWVNGGELVS